MGGIWRGDGVLVPPPPDGSKIKFWGGGVGICYFGRPWGHHEIRNQASKVEYVLSLLPCRRHNYISINVVATNRIGTTADHGSGRRGTPAFCTALGAFIYVITTLIN